MSKTASGEIMIKITMTQKAKTELLAALDRFHARSVRLIRQGYG